MRLVIPEHINPNHPLATQEYAVFTPPISELIDTVGDWINRMISGGYIYGPSGYGKSRGVKWFIRTALEERFEFGIPLVIWIRSTDMGVGETEFWEEILLASGFSFADQPKLRKKGKLRNEAVNRMTSIARSSQSNYVALVIDEAHEMTLREWKWLVTLQNKLDFSGIRLSVFSVGTQQLGYQHEFLAKTGNAHIAARFMVAHSPFHGLRNSDELKFVLEGYDQESEWPSDSGVSYFCHFSPNLYAKGHRLAQCSDVIWRALHALVPEEKRARYLKHIAESGLPMKHIALSIEEALWRLAEGKEWLEVTSYESWLEIISAMGFTGHFKAIAMEI